MNSGRSFIRKSAFGVAAMALGGLGLSAKSYRNIIGANDRLNPTWIFPGNKIIKWDGKSRNALRTYGYGRGTIIFGTEGSAYGAISAHLGHLANISSRIRRGFDVNPRNGQVLDRNALDLWSREYDPGWEPFSGSYPG